MLELLSEQSFNWPDNDLSRDGTARYAGYPYVSVRLFVRRRKTALTRLAEKSESDAKTGLGGQNGLSGQKNFAPGCPRIDFQEGGRYLGHRR